MILKVIKFLIYCVCACVTASAAVIFALYTLHTFNY